MASESHYGLSLVLGGGEVTAQELAKLYALLANRGELRPLRMQLNETESTPVRLLSEEASFITLDMLRQHRRPGDTLAQRSSSLPVYWKTGTSWLSRRLERRDFRPLRAGGVGRQLRRARQQCVGRRRGGRAAVLQYHRQRQRQLPRPAGTEAPVPQRLRRVDIASPAAICQRRGASRRARPGLFPASHRSRSTAFTGRWCWIFTAARSSARRMTQRRPAPKF